MDSLIEELLRDLDGAGDRGFALGFAAVDARSSHTPSAGTWPSAPIGLREAKSGEHEHAVEGRFDVHGTTTVAALFIIEAVEAVAVAVPVAELEFGVCG